MQILLIGYGKMGKTIEKLAINKGHKISGIVDVDSMQTIESHLQQADVAIEFTHPDAAVSNITQCIGGGLPVISGTTGWLSQYSEVAQIVEQSDAALLYASNFSLGVNIFFALNEKLASMMNRFGHYEIGITETHHTEKKDAPSGTAISLAHGIIDHSTYGEWYLDEGNKGNGIPITAIREGNVFGKHTVCYHSAIDDISITHNAHSRDGFALGAIAAAEWIIGKKGVFTIKDMMQL